MRQSFNRKAGKYTGKVDGVHYNQAWAGNALKVNFIRTVPLIVDLTPNDIIARGESYNYQENYTLLPVIEWDTYFIQEIVLGMQELGTFDVGVMFTLRTNDALPTVKTLPFEPEMLITQAVGQDSPNYGEVLNAWYGGRFVGRGSTMNPRGLLMDSIRGVYRYRLPGKEYKLLNPSSLYPGNVVEMSLDAGLPTPVPYPSNV